MRRDLIERKTPAEWNVRPLTEAHFWFYCGEMDILVREMPLERPGYATEVEGQRVIFLNDELRGARRLFVLFHEIAHHWLHPRRTHFYSGWEKEFDIEANVVAACALIPRTRIVHWSKQELAAEGIPDWIIKVRQETLDYWGI